MKSWDRVFDILKDELKSQLREELLEEFRSIAKEVIKSEADLLSGSKPKEYAHMTDLLDEHKISRAVFFKCRKQNYFDDYQQGRYKVYHVGQFLESLRNYKPQKPVFITL